MDMLTHKQIWAAIDALAQRSRMSTSGLARNSGLDPTTFNRSKRFTSAGRERWPSTESIAKILKATSTNVEDFMSLVSAQATSASSGRLNYREEFQKRGIPLIGFAKAGGGGFFDDGGFPVGQGWDQVGPLFRSENSYALKVSGDSMMPLYREGDIIIVDPDSQIRRGDRVVLKSRDGEVMAKVLERQTANVIELKSLNPDHPDLRFEPNDLDWMARIMWASQ